MIEWGVALIDQRHGDEHQITETRARALADPRGLLDSFPDPAPGSMVPAVLHVRASSRIQDLQLAQSVNFAKLVPVFVLHSGILQKSG